MKPNRLNIYKVGILWDSMADEKNRTEEVLDAWLNQIATALNRAESLAGFHRMNVEERRPGNYLDSFFHGSTELEVIDSQAYLQLLDMEWQEVKGTIDFLKVGKRRQLRMRDLETRLRSALNFQNAPIPRSDIFF